MKKIDVCKQYYQKIASKDLKGIELLIAKNIVIISPMDTVDSSIEGAVLAVTNFSKHLEQFDITSEFEKNNEVVLVYNFKLFDELLGGVSVMTVNDDLKIEKVRLFYDSYNLRKRIEDIFGAKK
jgi:hypothetical protein